MDKQPAEEDAAGKLHQLLRGHHSALDDAFETTLPEGTDFHYYRSFPDMKSKLTAWKGRLVSLLGQCDTYVHGGKGTTTPGMDMEDEDDVVEWASGLVDDALEAVDASLDAHRARLRAAEDPEAASTSGAAAPPPAKKARLELSTREQKAAVPRPQERFLQPVDNSNTPFLPRLDHLQALLDADKSLPVPATPPPVVPQGAYQHPFHARLEALAYPAYQLEAPAEARQPGSMEATPFTFVDTPEALQAMMTALEGVQEVAIDLEHHHFRSFQGFTCLLQLSSRSADWVVDTLALRGQLGAALGPLMADPRVVKVLHGADHDVLWLQKDYAIYIVNLFDTHQAARVLEYPGLGLAYLLKRHCNVKADKRYQLADWRIRPLTAEMLHYARCDTHYLLYIYDLLRAELQQQGSRVPEYAQLVVPEGRPAGALGTVLEASRQLCYQLYEKELFADDSYLQVARRWRLTMDARQLAVFAALYRWRDEVCRREDESTGYVLSRAQLCQVATTMPATVADLKHAVGRASEPVTRNLAQLLALVQAAKANPLPADVVQQLVVPEPSAAPAAAGPGAVPAAAASGSQAPAASTTGTDAAASNSAAAAGASNTTAAAQSPAAAQAPKTNVVVPVRRGGSMFGRRTPAARAPAPAPAPASQPAVAAAEAQELDAALAAVELLSGAAGGAAAAGGEVAAAGAGPQTDERQAASSGEAQERAQKLKESFQLPWQQPGSEVPEVAAAEPAEAEAMDAEPAEAEAMDAEPEASRSTAADVRAAMQQLRAEDAEQAAATPPAPGSAAAGGSGQGGAVQPARYPRRPPHARRQEVRRHAALRQPQLQLQVGRLSVAAAWGDGQQWLVRCLKWQWPLCAGSCFSVQHQWLAANAACRIVTCGA